MRARALIAAAVVAACTSGERIESTSQAVTITASQEALILLHDLQSKFKLRYEVEPTIDQLLQGDETPSTATQPVFGSSSVQKIERMGSALTPSFAAKPSANVTLADTASASIQLVAGGVTLRASLVGAQTVPAQVAEGYVVYKGGAPGGGHLLLRSSEQGVEDFVTLASAPATPSLTYKVELASGVGGLRLIGDVLEALDSSGTPRLRVRTPFLVDSTGEGFPAKLAVVGCSVDADPRGPWGRSLTAPGASSCDLVVSWSNAGIHYPAVLDPEWSTTGSLSQGRADHTMTLLDTGKVLAACGVNSGPGQPGAELYDPSSGTWAMTGTPIQTRSSHVAVGLTNGKVLMSGGTTGRGSLSSAELYDPALGTWSSTGSMVNSRKSFIGELLPNGKVLVSGGYGPLTIRATAELYNPTLGTWTSTGSMATARAVHRSTLMTSTAKVLVSGGSNAAGSYLSSAELYSQDAGTWSSAGSMSSARAAHGQTTLFYRDKVLVAGGTSNGSNVLTSTEIYDPLANSWSGAPSLTTGRKNFTAVRLHDSEVLLAGGDTGSSPTNTADLFRMIPPQTNATASMASARSRYAAAGLAGANTKILLAGGYNGTSYLTAAELQDIGIFATEAPKVADSWSRPRLMLTWDATESLTGPQLATYTITATLENGDTVAHNAYIDLTAIGLDGRVVTRSAYFNVSVAAGGSIQLGVDLILTTRDGEFPDVSGR